MEDKLLFKKYVYQVSVINVFDLFVYFFFTLMYM